MKLCRYSCRARLLILGALASGLILAPNLTASAVTSQTSTALVETADPSPEAEWPKTQTSAIKPKAENNNGTPKTQTTATKPKPPTPSPAPSKPSAAAVADEDAPELDSPDDQGTNPGSDSAQASQIEKPGESKPKNEKPTKPEKLEPATFTIVAAGDVLLHNAINRYAKTSTGYDYDKMLTDLDPWVQNADLALCNMETPIAPPGLNASYQGGNNENGPIPRFGVPKEIVRDLAKHGWDGCSTATNHSLDQGWLGIEATLDEFEKYGLGAVGTARTKTESQQPQFYKLERNGQSIKVAHLAMTWSTNGVPLPKDKPWAVQTLDTKRIISQATSARKAGADLVIVSLHAGIEYTEQLHPVQQSVPPELAKSGLVDLVIGHHPHVPQRIAKLKGGPNGNGMWVAYSLGNMISAQAEPERNTGLLLIADVAAQDGSARIKGVTYVGTVIDRPAGYRVRVISDRLKNPTGAGFSTADLNSRREIAARAVAGGAPERTTPPTPTGEPPTVIPRKR